MILLWRFVFAISLAVQLGAAAAFLGRAWRRPWSPGEAVALVLVASSLGDLAGPWLRSIGPVAAWPLGALPAVATWATIAFYQGWCLWNR